MERSVRDGEVKKIMEVLENNPEVKKELVRKMKESDDEEKILLSEMIAMEKKTRLLKQEQVREGWKTRYEKSRRMEMITDYLRKLDINLEDMEWSEHVELDEIIEKLKISTITNKVTDIEDEEMELNKLYSKLIEGLDEGAIENEFVSEDKSDDDVEMEFESWVKFEIEAMGVAMEQGGEGDGLQDDDQAVVMEHPVNLMINPSRENCRPAKDWKLKRRRGIIPDLFKKSCRFSN